MALTNKTMNKLKWVTNWENAEAIEYDLITNSFTLFRVVVSKYDHKVKGVPVYPAIIDHDWYNSLKGLTFEFAKEQIMAEFQ